MQFNTTQVGHLNSEKDEEQLMITGESRNKRKEQNRTWFYRVITNEKSTYEKSKKSYY